MKCGHLDLFSGIGGFALAAKWAGFETVGFCEIEEFPIKVLQKNFPRVPIHGDIRGLNGYDYRGIPLITGGYPCQPFSVAGSQKTTEDNRFLWPEMLRIISQAQPKFVVCENVYGHISLGLDDVLHDLETIGYSAQPFVISANSTGKPHLRQRIFIVANPAGDGLDGGTISRGDGAANGDQKKGTHKNIYDERCSCVRSELDWGGGKEGGWGTEPPSIRVDDGVSKRLDKDRRLRNRGVGKALIPQIAYEILRCVHEQIKSNNV